MYSRCLKRVLDFCCALAAIACFGVPTQAWGGNSPVISANPYAAFSNGNAYLQQGVPLLLEYHCLTTGDSRQRFAYPQRNYEFRSAKKKYTSSVDALQMGADINLNVSLFTDFTDGAPDDYTLPGFSAGISAAGYADSLDFDFNAALYMERHDIENPHTVDHQETGWVLWDHDGGDVINYKRMHGHFGLNYAWLRLEMGRDALHWGPGIYNNLTLNRQAVPYRYASIDLVFGPLRVISFYGSLEIDSVGSRTNAHGDRNLYGHRYELALGNATFGMSEIQTIYNENNAWLLVPIYPLFMEKGNYTEHNNNGALAFDANYRIMRSARIYSEFHIDDIQSPIALVENKYVSTHWAWLAGAQVAHDFKFDKYELQLGSIFEYARVDQRVYTHYEPNEAQLANAGYPLGNQLGPNSQTIDWLLYSQINNTLFAGVRNTWQWKGNVYGSDLNGKWESDEKKKNFLGGAKMKYSFTPMLAYHSDCWNVSGSVVLFDDIAYQIGLTVIL